jgi:hypothetical protein
MADLPEPIRNNLNSKILLIGMISLFACRVSFAQLNTDFSGQWRFNPSQSDPGEGGKFLDSETTLYIHQTSDSIRIGKKIIRPGSRDIISAETYKLNGSVTFTPDKNQSKIVITHWSDDQQTLFIYTDWAFTTGGSIRQFSDEDSYRLTGEGKVLTVLSTSQNIAGESRMILVYNRAQ